mmetsp:Transcript_26296/g.28299  ORF Transcript_26296/g.28299 Transcript_26296/m.28299 type:complete len:201 (-) Transcript_26296:25-627(-)
MDVEKQMKVVEETIALKEEETKQLSNQEASNIVNTNNKNNNEEEKEDEEEEDGAGCHSCSPECFPLGKKTYQANYNDSGHPRNLWRRENANQRGSAPVLAYVTQGKTALAKFLLRESYQNFTHIQPTQKLASIVPVVAPRNKFPPPASMAVPIPTAAEISIMTQRPMKNLLRHLDIGIPKTNSEMKAKLMNHYYPTSNLI